MQRNNALNSEATAIAEANAKSTALVNEENARATAQAEKVRAEEQANIALARQLAAQAYVINTDHSSNQMLASLLAIQSMKLLPIGESARFLLNDNHSGLLIARMTHDDHVTSVAFSPDGKYVVSGSDDALPACGKPQREGNCPHDP